MTWLRSVRTYSDHIALVRQCAMMLTLLMITLAAASPPDDVVPCGGHLVASMRKIAVADADAQLQCATS